MYLSYFLKRHILHSNYSSFDAELSIGTSYIGIPDSLDHRKCNEVSFITYTYYVIIYD